MSSLQTLMEYSIINRSDILIPMFSKNEFLLHELIHNVNVVLVLVMYL